MLRHGCLARNFGDDGGFARDEIIERVDDIDPAQLRARWLGAAGPGERADDPRAVCRVGGAQRGDHVLRHAAAADEADRGHTSITAD